MKKHIEKSVRLTNLCLIVVLIIGFFFRYYNYTVWPRDGATFDEYAWTWLGMSLLTRGVPTSWSSHPQYKSTAPYINANGAQFNLATPYLEHPPLFGIIAGGFAYLRGARSFDDIVVARIRPLGLILGVFSIYVVFLLSGLLYGPIIALISAFIYAVIPSVVVGSRLVQNENFFIPFFLLTLYFGIKYVQAKNYRDFIIASICSATLIMAKVPWVAASIALVGILLYYNDVKKAIIVVTLTTLSLLGYFIYGAFFDMTIFWNLMHLQIARYGMVFSSVFALSTDPIVTDRLFIDGWIFVGWLSLVVLASTQFKKNAPLLLGFLSYFIIYIAGIPNEPGHGWYRYPFYPFLAISLGVFIVEFFNKNHILTFVFLLFIGLSFLQHTWLVAFGFSYGVLRLFLFWCALGLLPLISKHPIVRKFTYGVNYSTLAIIIFLTMWTSLWYNEL